MSRLYHAGAETGADHAEGLTLVGTTLTYDTGTVRTGTRSWKFDSSAASTLTYTFTGSPNVRHWACIYVRFPAATGLPSANSRILQFLDTTSALVASVNLTTTGKLQLLNSGNTQEGVDSAVTLVADTWYRVELQIETGTLYSIAAKVDGVPIAANTGGSHTNGPGKVVFGWIDDPGTSEVMFFDDLSLNDIQGSVNNSWVGPSAVYLLLPASDNADGGWTAGAGGTSLFAGVDNVPPAGAASPGTNASQIGNAVSSTTDNADLNLTDYTTAGVSASDTVAAVYGVFEGADSSTTGSDTMRIAMVSNPAITQTSPSIAIVAGTYPTGWNRLTTTMSENPTVTRGTAPVIRVGKNVANVRRANVCFMGLYVGAVTPVVAAPSYNFWTPGLLSSPPRAWYKAEDISGVVDGYVVASWPDAMAAFNGTQSTNGNKPWLFLDGLNHRPYVFFSGTDRLNTTQGAISNDETIYAVATWQYIDARVLIGTTATNGKFLKLATGNFMRYVHSAVVEMTIGTTAVPQTGSIIGGTISSTTAGIYHVDGVDQTFSHTDTFSGAGTYDIGANLSSEYWRGSIYELIVTPALGTADRQMVEGYLAHKYALTGNLPGGHPYKTNPPGSLAPEFANRVTQAAYRM